uniref:Secreted protein n=1 Tax=Opuntia streptacantha TaxID=393608 RepID=A0A7C9ERV3_OPUST
MMTALLALSPIQAWALIDSLLSLSSFYEQYAVVYESYGTGNFSTPSTLYHSAFVKSLMPPGVTLFSTACKQCSEIWSFSCDKNVQRCILYQRPLPSSLGVKEDFCPQMHKGE